MRQNWTIKESQIHGIGVYTTNFIPKGKMIDVGIIYHLKILPNVTYFGGKINHSYNPNAILRYSKETNTWNVYAKKDIKENNEVTIDYNDTPTFIKGPDKRWGIRPNNYTLLDKSY